MLESLKCIFMDVIVQDIVPQDIISVNIWAILISLANLVILFFILKKFLFKPVKRMLNDRQKTIDDDYQKAKESKIKAKANEAEINNKLTSINENANEIIKKAESDALLRSENIIAEANEKAEQILTQAKKDTELEKKTAYNNIKKDIADVSVALTEKILEREVSLQDHQDLIESFIAEMGDKDGTEK